MKLKKILKLFHFWALNNSLLNKSGQNDCIDLQQIKVK